MGCASSSPLITAATTNGGVMGAAKGAATDAVHAGEEVLNDVKDTINQTVGHVKEAVVEAVHNVGTGLDNVLNGKKEDSDTTMEKIIPTTGTEKPMVNNDETESDFKIIPLKDPSEKINEMKDTLNDILNNKSDMIVEDITDETEKLTDELIKETEDISTATTAAVEDTTKVMQNVLDKSVTSMKTINKSISQDSLQTNSPDPEIEKAMSNIDLNDPPTPKPTFLELEQLQKASSAVIESVAAKNASEMMLME